MAEISAGVATAKLGLDIASHQGWCFICDRERYFVTMAQNLESLKNERGELMKLAEHVQSRCQEMQRENPPREPSYNTSRWVHRVGVDGDKLNRVIQEAEAEIGFKCRTFFCPKNKLYCSAVGDNVKRKLEYVNELSKEGRQHADAVEAKPSATQMNLQTTGRQLPVEGLRPTDMDPASSSTAPAQP